MALISETRLQTLIHQCICGPYYNNYGLTYLRVLTCPPKYSNKPLKTFIKLYSSHNTDRDTDNKLLNLHRDNKKL